MIKYLKIKSIAAVLLCTASLVLASNWYHNQQNPETPPQNKGQALPGQWVESAKDSCSGAYIQLKIYNGEISANEAAAKIAEWKEWKKVNCTEGWGVLPPPIPTPTPIPIPTPTPVGKMRSGCCQEFCFKINHSDEANYKLLLSKDNGSCEKGYEEVIGTFRPPEAEILNRTDSLFYLFVLPKNLPILNEIPFDNDHKADCLQRLAEFKEPKPLQIKSVLDTFNIYCLLPSTTTGKVWLINITENRTFEIKVIKPEWFKKEGYYNQLHRIAIATLYDSELKIEYKKENLEKIVISGTHKNKKFIYGIDNSYFQTCISSDCKLESLKQLDIMDYLIHSGHENNLKNFYREWFYRGGSLPQVAHFLPVNNSLNPKTVLGIKSGDETQPSFIGTTIRANSPSKLLVMKNRDFYIYSERGIPIPVKNSDAYPNHFWGYWLMLADPSVHFIIKGNEGQGKYFFIFKNDTKKIWSWEKVKDGKKAPQIEEVLDGTPKAALSGVPIENLIKEWHKEPSTISEVEKKFLSDLPRSRYRILDWLHHKDNPQDRIILYANPADTKANSFKLYRSQQENQLPIDIQCVDTKCTEWADLSTKYLDFKQQIEDNLIYSAETQQEVWFAADRLAISKSKEEKITFYFKKQSKRFKKSDIKWLGIESIILSDKPILYLDKQRLTKELFLNSVLNDKWKDNFRANPLGYYDRASSNN